MYKLRINPIALEDLIEIKKYFENELDNPSSANKIIEKIIKRYESLKDYPLMGADLRLKIGIKTDYRFLTSGNYLIFYKCENEYVSVYRILYGKRDYLKLLFHDKYENSDNK
jgi:toxin ParE1/3/4